MAALRAMLARTEPWQAPGGQTRRCRQAGRAGLSHELRHVGHLSLVVVETIGMMVLLLHWTACAQFGHAARQQEDESTWLALSPNEGLAAAGGAAQYAVALFRAVCQMLALGYGRAAGIPASVGEVWLMLASMLLGGVLYAFMLAVGGAVLSNVDICGTQCAAAYADKENRAVDVRANEPTPAAPCRHAPARAVLLLLLLAPPLLSHCCS